MLQSAKSNQFRFNFPRAFIPEAIAAKYAKYMNRIPGNIISDPLDLINYSVQSVTLPSFSYTPVEQVDFPGTKRQYRSSLPVTELFAKELTIGMQMFDGHFNYWMMYEIFQYYYEFREKSPYLPDGFRLQMVEAISWSLSDYSEFFFKVCLILILTSQRIHLNSKRLIRFLSIIT
jgi:hypothetical protein